MADETSFLALASWTQFLRFGSEARKRAGKLVQLRLEAATTPRGSTSVKVLMERIAEEADLCERPQEKSA